MITLVDYDGLIIQALHKSRNQDSSILAKELLEQRKDCADDNNVKSLDNYIKAWQQDLEKVEPAYRNGFLNNWSTFTAQENAGLTRFQIVSVTQLKYIVNRNPDWFGPLKEFVYKYHKSDYVRQYLHTALTPQGPKTAEASAPAPKASEPPKAPTTQSFFDRPHPPASTLLPCTGPGCNTSI
ncbi:hypothetical protein ACFORL_06250 [Legionella dresdenensis]|uniref:Uncharacterized protein n=1 Tax=Legionella dresdenensis TaxID=450200 RepID=A0ABV8CFE1_9GAMM